ncbi:MAG: hypothetical protein M3Z08_16380 [Chloroflexota bacterium]|nr:hypothetical protein [Chloroflexota bacterium]
MIVNQTTLWHDNDPEKDEISRYRNSICEILSILSNYVELQNVDDQAINGFISDLAQIANNVVILPDTFFNGKNTFCELIKGAVFDLHTVLAALSYISNNGFDGNVWRQTYDHLDKCKTRLEQALQRLVIDTT